MIQPSMAPRTMVSMGSIMDWTFSTEGPRTLNGLILPITLGVMLVAAYNKKIVGEYKHPVWMAVFGAIVVVMTAYMGYFTMTTQLGKLFA